VTTTVGVNFGALLTTGTIDVDNSGLLGLNGALGGIDVGEGFILGLNAIGFNNALAWKVTGIKFTQVGGDEQWTIVNRNDTSKSLSGNTNDIMVDVSSLNLQVQGGVNDTDFASIFGSGTDTGAFRVSGFEIEAIPEPSSALLLGLSSALLFVRRRRH
jgi:hypothetical protein